MVTTRSAATALVRPAVGELVTAAVDCAVGEQVIGGGTRAVASDPADAARFHLLDDGPTPSGWTGTAASTSRFAVGSTLSVTATAFCLEVVP
jgi:hypothetical protein